MINFCIANLEFNFTTLHSKFQGKHYLLIKLSCHCQVFGKGLWLFTLLILLMVLIFSYVSFGRCFWTFSLMILGLLMVWSCCFSHDNRTFSQLLKNLLQLYHLLIELLERELLGLVASHLDQLLKIDKYIASLLCKICEVYAEFRPLPT